MNSVWIVLDSEEEQLMGPKEQSYSEGIERLSYPSLLAIDSNREGELANIYSFRYWWIKLLIVYTLYVMLVG